jgi:hypothetical protein
MMDPTSMTVTPPEQNVNFTAVGPTPQAERSELSTGEREKAQCPFAK